MRDDVEKLLILQDRDRKIRLLQRELDNLPGERTGLQSKLQAIDEQLEKAKERAKQIEVERKRLEVEAGSKRDTINKYRTQQLQTRKNEEYQALGNEIARFEKDISGIEDQELELMEEAEQLAPQIRSAETEAAQAREQTRRQLADLDAKGEAIQKQLDELASNRDALTADLDEDLLDRYQRLFKSKGDAVVPVERGVCAGCHMQLPTHTTNLAKAERGIASCDQCGRILYYEP